MRTCRRSLLGLHVEELTPLELVDGRASDEVHEIVERDGLADRHELDDLPLGVGQATEAEPDHLTETGRRRQASRETPEAADVSERAGVLGAEDKLAEEQGVAAAGRPEGLGGVAVHRPAEHGVQQRARRGRIERRDVDADDVLVLPELDDGLRGLGAAARRDDEEDLRRAREQVQQRRRAVVERMRVVDDEQQPGCHRRRR